MTDKRLQKRAYREASQLLRADCDAVDLAPDLSYDDEEKIREFIRTVIAEELASKSK